MKPGYLLPIIALAVLLGNCSGLRPDKSAPSTRRTMLTTGYCKCGICCNWTHTWYGKPVIAAGPNKGDPKDVGVTASGSEARVGTIAADTNLYPFGTIMYIPGYGYGRVEDRGSAIKGQHIDLYFKTHKKATAWGRQTKEVTVWLNK